MKKKFLKVLCLSTLAGLTLTGCNSLLPQGDQNMPNPPSGSDVTTNQTTENIPNEEVDLVNDAVNDSLKYLAKKMNQPMFRFSSDVKLTNKREGNVTTKEVIKNNYTGQESTGNVSGPSYYMMEEIHSIKARANIDNLYYLASKAGAEKDLTNRSDMRFIMSDSYNSLGDIRRTAQDFTVVDNTYKTRVNEGTFNNIDNQNNYLGQRIGGQLDSIYLTASNLEYDASFETLAQIFVLLSQISPDAYAHLQTADTIHLIDSTIKMIDDEISAEAYLDILLTRYLFLDSETLNPQDRLFMIQILSAAQRLTLDDVLIVGKENNKITATLNYDKVKQILQTLSTAIKALDQYLKNSNVASYNNINLEKLAENLTFVPSNISFVREFTLNNDVINKYSFDVTISNGEIPNFDEQTHIVNNGNETITTTESYSLITLKSHANITFDYSDEYVSTIL